MGENDIDCFRESFKIEHVERNERPEREGDIRREDPQRLAKREGINGLGSAGER